MKYNYLNQNDKQNNGLHCGVDELFQYQKHCICDHNVFRKVVLQNAHMYAMIETASRTILLEPAKDLVCVCFSSSLANVLKQKTTTVKVVVF